MRQKSKGFTIVEILIVITIIGVLTTIGAVSFSAIQSGARNTQRSSKMTVIAEALEKYYSQNGEYPTCASIAAPVSVGVVSSTILKGIDPDVLATPSASGGTNSIVCRSDTSNLTSDVFGYVGGGDNYALEYLDESTGDNVLLVSRHNYIPNSGGNAIASEILSGKTATTDSGAIVGTMPNKVGSGTVITPSAVDQAIPKGYYGGLVGDGKIAATVVPHSSQAYTTPGTYPFTVPAGVTKATVLVCAGGGGGAGSANVDYYMHAEAGSGGGSGGVYMESLTLTPGSQISVVVGAGGAGELAPRPADGSGGGGGAGGNSSFASYTAYGGVGGLYSYTPGAGGAGGGSYGGSGTSGTVGGEFGREGLGGTGGVASAGGQGGGYPGTPNGRSGANGRVIILW